MTRRSYTSMDGKRGVTPMSEPHPGSCSETEPTNVLNWMLLNRFGQERIRSLSKRTVRHTDGPESLRQSGWSFYPWYMRITFWSPRKKQKKRSPCGLFLRTPPGEQSLLPYRSSCSHGKASAISGENGRRRRSLFRQSSFRQENPNRDLKFP